MAPTHFKHTEQPRMLEYLNDMACVENDLKVISKTFHMDDW